MGKELHCREVGMNCDAVVRGETVDEVMKQAAEHAAKDHGITEITAEMATKVKAAIKDT
ncbi:MAG: DUF1059 domain-containing protein [candidate division NC10 bacterium]|nr:DUF1059 domain-containing protein [candidate division NC10 bacterium]